AGCSIMLFRYEGSVFRKFKNQQFWNPVEAAKQYKTVFGYKLTGFHFMQSGSIFLFCLPAALYINDNIRIFVTDSNLKSIIHFFISYFVVGLVWNGCFEQSYKKIWWKKSNENGSN
ncbi:MAG: hypothetical protein RLY43_2454, partial [Bacteroidota bacterium]